MQRNKFLAILLSVALLVTLLSGCGPTKQSDPEPVPVESTEEGQAASEQTTVAPQGTEAEAQVLVWNLGSDPKTLDPTLNGASDGGHICNNTFEGLVREREGVVVPGIAESWEISDDGLTYTFHLRDAMWSDGTPLTANDFEFAWKRGMDPATASEYSWIWEFTNVAGALELISPPSKPKELSEEDQEDADKVAKYDEELAAYEEAYDAFLAEVPTMLDNVGVKALDEKTLEVKLTTPTDYLLSLLSFYHFMPTNAAAVEGSDQGAWAKDPAKAVCDGPFKLTEYTIGKGLVLEKNENYWDADNVHLTKIEVKFITEATTAYSAYQNEEIQLLLQVPNPEIPKLMAESSEYHVYPLLGTYYYNFNLNKEMWQDARVRKAFNLAINRELICETMATGVIPAAGFVPPGMPDHEGNDFFETSGTYGIAADDSQVAEAQQLMADAGYPNGEGFPEFTILYNTSEGHKLIAEMVQEMLKKNLGVECKLKNSEWAVFQDQRKQGQFEVARGGWITDYLDPSGLLSIFSTENAYNDPKFNNAEYDELLSTAASTTGAEHFEALYKAQEILMTELPIIPIYHYTDSVMAKDSLVGWTRQTLGQIDLTNAYFIEE